MTHIAPSELRHAAVLREAWSTRTPCAAPTAAEPDLSVDAAYRIQRTNIDARLERGMDGAPTRLVGYKVGLTSPSIQSWLGIDQPDFGCLLSDMEVADGGVIDASLLLQPRIEAELAFVLERDLRGPVGAADVLRATAIVLPALEVIDSRIAEWKISYPDTIADNASSGLFVLGTTPIDLASTDFRTVGMTMRHNGRIASVGAGAACLGNPVAAVAWLANTLAGVDVGLEAGQVVLSGALGPVASISAGDWIDARIGSGRVSARVG